MKRRAWITFLDLLHSCVAAILLLMFFAALGSPPQAIGRVRHTIAFIFDEPAVLVVIAPVLIVTVLVLFDRRRKARERCSGGRTGSHP